MVLEGTNVTANGVIINDPDRDTDVPPILWEIRRERAVELSMEGQRRNDLQRWGKFSYLKTAQVDDAHPSELAYGAIFDYRDLSSSVKASVRKSNPKLYSFNADSSLVAVYNLYNVKYRRDWKDDDVTYTRQYFQAVPLNTIKFYKDKGHTLTQNPGWDN